MRRVLPALLTLVLLSACSSDGDEPSATPPDPTSSSAQPTDAASPGTPPDIEGLVVTPPQELTRGHVEGKVDYDALPPVGGDHNARWLACDVYDEPVPDEAAVHSLEHGAAWITHSPDLPESEVEQLAELAELDEEYVLVTPYEGLDSRIVAVAWGFSLEVSSADDPRLEQFVRTFAGGAQGGEPGVPCRSGGVSPREARGLVQASGSA